jgi:hypothetical protein
VCALDLFYAVLVMVRWALEARKHTLGTRIVGLIVALIVEARSRVVNKRTYNAVGNTNFI